MTDEMLATDEVERPVEDSDSSPETNEEDVNLADTEEQEEAPEKPKEEAEADPDWYIKAINRQHKKYRDEERRRLELEQQLSQYQRQTPQNARPEIPPAPDPFDEDYERKIEARDAAIRKAAAWDAHQEALTQYQRQRQQEAMQQQAQALQKTLTSYTERAKEYGIKPEHLQTAGNAVATMGIHDDVASMILADERGPLITTYLARNPAELEAMQSMSPVQAAVYVATKVKAKAESAHGFTKAPRPPESLEGGGAPPKQRGPKGATFE